MSADRVRLALAVLALTALLGADAAAQKINFRAHLDGSQVVPPAPTGAEGNAVFVFDVQSRKLTLRMETTCVAPQPYLYLALGAPGQTGASFFAQFPTSFNVDMYQSTTQPLTQAQVDALFTGNVYCQITGQFTFGQDIRGQLYPAVRTLVSGDLDGQATGSLATGHAVVSVDQPQDLLLVEVGTSGVAATQIELRTGQPFAPTSQLIADFAPVNGAVSTVVPSVSPVQLGAILSGDAHVLVRSLAFPGGEIAGVVHPQATREFACWLDGNSMVPPVQTAALGLARASLNTATNVLTYDVLVGGMNGTSATLGAGSFGMPTTPIANLSGGFNHWSGSLPLGPGGAAQLVAHGLHFSVASAAFPAGEIRGALLQNPLVYGYGSNSGFAQVRTSYEGRHVLGTTDWVAKVSGAAPGKAAMLFIGFANGTWSGQPLPVNLSPGLNQPYNYLWVAPVNLLFFPTVADANGAARVPIAIPNNAALLGLEAYYQWIVYAGLSPSFDYSVSDALRVFVQ